MKIFLLTHERELKKASNTGSIALKYAPHVVERIIWQRVSPNKHLTSLIERNQALLLYQVNVADAVYDNSVQWRDGETQSDCSVEIANHTTGMCSEPSAATKDNADAPENGNDSALIDSFENIIIIDSTWQESRKIFNRSPYLQRAPRTSLNTYRASEYRLRRNQVVGGLCSIECIIEVLKIKGEYELAARLSEEYSRFNQP